MQIFVNTQVFGDDAPAVATVGQTLFPGITWAVGPQETAWPASLTDEQWDAQQWIADREDEQRAGKPLRLEAADAHGDRGEWPREAPDGHGDGAPAPAPRVAAAPPAPAAPPESFFTAISKILETVMERIAAVPARPGIVLPVAREVLAELLEQRASAAETEAARLDEAAKAARERAAKRREAWEDEHRKHLERLAAERGQNAESVFGEQALHPGLEEVVLPGPALDLGGRRLWARAAALRWTAAHLPERIALTHFEVEELFADGDGYAQAACAPVAS